VFPSFFPLEGRGGGALVCHLLPRPFPCPPNIRSLVEILPLFSARALNEFELAPSDPKDLFISSASSSRVEALCFVSFLLAFYGIVGA